MNNKIYELSEDEFISLIRNSNNLDHNEIARYGSINEMCQAVINAGETRTKIIKTCRNTFNRNRNKVWLGSYWKVITPENYKEL